MTKVTLGCRIAPVNKLALTAKAKKLGISLSEYTEALILNNHHLEEKKEALVEENEALNLALAAANKHIKKIHTSIFSAPKQFDKIQFLKPLNLTANDQV